jgi:hypothetical protein
MIGDTTFENFPPIMDVVEPVLQAAPSVLQVDIRDLVIELYKASPSETTFLLKQILSTSDNQMTTITMRRISSYFPAALQTELKDFLRAVPISQTVAKEMEEFKSEISAADTLASGPAFIPSESQKPVVQSTARKATSKTQTVPRPKNDSKKGVPAKPKGKK